MYVRACVPACVSVYVCAYTSAHAGHCWYMCVGAHALYVGVRCVCV